MVNCYETTGTTDDRPYYYVLDRMYNVRFLVDRAGAIVERYAYDPYGKPLIRESTGRGDTRHYSLLYSATAADINAEVANTIWDPRCDMDDDGDVDSADSTAYTAKDAIWPLPSYDQPTVSQAFSDVGNPYMFQGVPHFAIDTSSSATAVKFPLNHHRARFSEPITGRWVTRDPLGYNTRLAIGHSFPQSWLRMSRPQLGKFLRNTIELFGYVSNAPSSFSDPSGLICCGWGMNVNIGVFCWMVCPWNVTDVQNAATTAMNAGLAAANARFDPSAPEHEAFRHCVASGYLATQVGCYCSNCIGDTREYYQQECVGQSDANTNKARNNNRVGLKAAGCTGDNTPNTTLVEIIQGCEAAHEDLDLTGGSGPVD